MNDRKRIAAEFSALLPRYDVSIYIEHNDHKGVYEPIEQYLDRSDHFDITPEDRAECIATDSLWVAQWYPRTPVGFCAVGAPTLERLLELLGER